MYDGNYKQTAARDREMMKFVANLSDACLPA